ncbi:hypothetical protein [Anaerobium acetethylicum]|uniref:YopX protein n=1 Tax=Anaerobium acetethylicum TaxID=1619234 RepID=A0A1D3TXY7_9FIRM|nr:hypothetical protein [Anaerobium acetethylicum]SCP99273.1 hypothetical protein SAMN05421730_103632 [Anaerobium acetethylicum]
MKWEGLRIYNLKYKQIKDVFGISIETGRVYLDEKDDFWWNINECELMKQTEFLDDCKRPIYSGDLLKLDKKLFVVKWSIERNNYVLIDVLEQSKFLEIHELPKCGNVLGNMYEMNMLIEECKGMNQQT